MSTPVQQKPHSRIRVNLLYPQGTPQKLPVRFLGWLIAYGRFIVIFVEILVVASFLARFKYDSDLADLKEQINAQIPYLESISNDETIVVQTQNRLSLAKQVFNSTPNWSDILYKISSQVSRGVKITSINMQHSSNTTGLDFKITAQAKSNSDLTSFVDGLKTQDSFQNISLASISYDTGGIVFTITGKTN